MGGTARTAPGLWDALRGCGVRQDLAELLDAPHPDPRDLRQNLAHLRLMNRWLGWSASVWRDIDRLLRRHRLRSASVLDIATGTADIPADLARRAAHRGLSLRIVATDISRPVLVEAWRRQPQTDMPQLMQHAGASLPFRDGAFDVVTLCLAAHHFAPDALTVTLREMWRVARVGVIVNDLARSRAGYLAARAMALVLRNRLTSHDGPVSVLRAYTPLELRRIAEAAGLRDIRLHPVIPARMALVAEKQAHAWQT